MHLNWGVAAVLAAVSVGAYGATPRVISCGLPPTQSQEICVAQLDTSSTHPGAPELYFFFRDAVSKTVSHSFSGQPGGWTLPDKVVVHVHYIKSGSATFELEDLRLEIRKEQSKAIGSLYKNGKLLIPDFEMDSFPDFQA